MPKNLDKDSKVVIPIYGGRMKWKDIKMRLGGAAIESKKRKFVYLVEQGEGSVNWEQEMIRLNKFKNK